MKRLITALLSMLLVFNLSVTAFAASSYFTYEGHNIFGFGPGSEHTDTDLFDNFKGVMPGDTLTETITVKNTAACCDFVKIYLRAKPHGDSNPLSSEVAEAETVVSMEDFLSQLTMTVWNGDTKIYEGSPDELDGLKNNVLLGTFRRNQGTTLTVELKVPIELGNEYANRVGEVDWVFVVEEYDDANPDIPQTGDHSHIMLYATLMAVSFMGIILLLLFAKRKKKAEQ